MKLHRIRHLGTSHQQAMASYTPVGGTHPAGTAATPMTAPMSQVSYHPSQAYPWGTMAYEVLHVVWAADGAPVAASAGTVHQPGLWGRVVPAGTASPAHR